jgi:hypothetical protein
MRFSSFGFFPYNKFTVSNLIKYTGTADTRFDYKSVDIWINGVHRGVQK